MEQMKTCIVCGKEKPITKEFFKPTRNYFFNQCKECMVIRDKLYRQQNKERLNTYANNYHKENREERLEYSKKYHKEHKEQEIIYRNQYKEFNKDKQIEYRKQRYHNNKEKILEITKEYYQLNKEKYRENYKLYRVINKDKISAYGKEYRQQNKEKVTEIHKRYRALNPEKGAIKTQMRRAKQKKLISNYSEKEWEQCKSNFNHECSYCSKQLKNLTQDHVIPVNKGGHYIKQNIVPACKSCNSSKNAQTLETWYPKQPFYSKEKLDKIHQWMGVKNNLQQLKII